MQEFAYKIRQSNENSEGEKQKEGKLPLSSSETTSQDNENSKSDGKRVDKMIDEESSHNNPTIVDSGVAKLKRKEDLERSNDKIYKYRAIDRLLDFEITNNDTAADSQSQGGISKTENVHNDSTENITAERDLKGGHYDNDTKNLHSLIEGTILKTLDIIKHKPLKV
ncbi:hypothetical protein CEXT_236181 [Caerostris extrusa]|uniref:Uncharacterized protein n=1 Tax=Caerostris extrusa TaxID=172846 RepID=A0AAV4SGX3_CAEEX|nr:hypothetical protein CEXT_236181 [Caerostris extrusa]